jgi:predicted ribosomally synthesized peptide with SipW-like signal peptide
VVDASTSGAHKVSIQLGLTIVPENISKGELVAQKENRRKVRAILAGGLVLGIGAAVTLAAWNDSEFAEGVFTSGGFNLEGNITGEAGAFAEHATTGSAASLTFTSPQVNAANLAPGDSVSSAFAVRLAEGTTVNADVTLSSVLKEGDPDPGLTYTVKTTNIFGCDNPENSIYTVGKTEIGSEAGGSFVLTPAVDPVPAGIVNLCFTVTAGEQGTTAGEPGTLKPNRTSVVSWELTAKQSTVVEQ